MSAENGKAAHHLEHVDEYILENPDLFNLLVLKVPPSKYYPRPRLTIDYEEDYLKACNIMEVTQQAEQASSEKAIKYCLHSV